MIQFEHKEFFWAFLLIAVFLLLFVYFNGWKRKAWKRFGDGALTNRLIIQKSNARSFVKFLLLTLALFFLVTGIIDPKVGSRLEKVKRKGIDLYIALDVSNSMLAQDIKPDRLDRAKMAISNLINELNGDRVGLIVFAGQAYKQLPLTTDYSAAQLFLSAVSTKIVPVQGTAIGAAINLATQSFEDDKHNKAIIVISDGENHSDDPIAAAKEAAAKGIRVFTIGMGLPDGAPIPISDNNGSETYLKDKQGNVVVTKLNQQMLEDIAAAGKGTYSRANNASVGLDTILKNINKIQKQEIEEKQFTDYVHRFQYFLIPAILLLILELITLERKPEWASKFDFFGK
ncbi:MAG: VWA domain-containing protein [Bacteroidales bacterium]|nr:VWA domain-containing protein [Bacteroidales bacterium]